MRVETDQAVYHVKNNEDMYVIVVAWNIDDEYPFDKKKEVQKTVPENYELLGDSFSSTGNTMTHEMTYCQCDGYITVSYKK